MLNKKTFAMLGSMGCLVPALSTAAQIGSVTFDGFADVIYTMVDNTVDGANSDENRFVTSGEIDLATPVDEGIDVRFDLDLNPSGDGDSARFEQAYINWMLAPQWTLKGGVFNNRLAWESEDAPDLYQISHGQLYEIWNAETSRLSGNNVAGVELGFTFDQIKLYAGLLNDLRNVPEEASFELAAEIQPLPNLNLVAGMITEDQGAETLFDVHGTWRWTQLLLGAEMLFAGEIYDLAFGFTANYAFTERLSGTVRYDFVSYDQNNIDETASLTFAALCSVREHVFLNGEVRLNQDDNRVPIIGDGAIVAVELLATF